VPASSAEIDILNELRDRLRRLEDAASKHQKHFNQSQAARHLGRSKEWLRILHLQKRGRAVALAGLGWLPDTILSRSIIVRMRRRHAGERVEQYRHRVNSREGHQLRDTLAAWAAGVTDALANARPDMPSGVEDRAADCWEPLLAIADAIGGEWPKRARAAAVSLVSDAKEVEPSLGIKLLADLQTVFGDAGLMSTAAILKALHELTESPWNDLKGKPLNDRGLALRLRQYGVKSKQIRVGDITLKGYDRADLFDVWKRYLPQSSDKAKTSETSETSSGFQASGASDVSDAPPNVSDTAPEDPEGERTKKPNKAALVSDVSAVSLTGDDRGDDPGPIPDFLKRTPNRCDHCGTTGKLQPWDWPGRPDGITLHSSCEGAWFDGKGWKQ